MSENSSIQPILLQTQHHSTCECEVCIREKKCQESNSYDIKLPPHEHPINEDIFPIIIPGKPEVEEQIQDVTIRYLKPLAPEPGPIIYKYDADKTICPAPPLILEERPPTPCTPPPIIYREEPPPLPALIPPEIIHVPGKILPAPPRQVIVEKYETYPAKPPPIIIEKWLPYECPERQVIHEYLQESPCSRQCSVLSHCPNQSRIQNEPSHFEKYEHSNQVHHEHHGHHKHHCGCCHKQGPQHVVIHSNHSCSCEHAHKCNHELLNPIVHNAMIKYAMPPAKLRFPSFQRLPFVSKLPSYSPLAYIPNRFMSNLNVRMNLNSCSSLNWWKKSNWNHF